MDEGDLTRKQREVVNDEGDLILVLGDAGSGKTTTALWAARAELHRRDDSSAHVVFLAFSRTSVDQISSRARTALTLSGDRIEIATFHALAFRLVRSFGRYAGFGAAIPDLQSPAHIRLHGQRDGLLSYDDLLPIALEILRSERVRELLAARWPLIICDEFQDTSDQQWELLDLLRGRSRLMLLADPNQMIYSFLPGVGPQRLRQAKDLADSVVELESSSHRDPSGAIPALAAAVRWREFTAGAVTSAVEDGRLTVRAEVDDGDLVGVIGEELRSAWRAGARDFGIFGHSNEGVASLGHHLAEAGIDHVLIGLSDAQGEALATMATMCRFAVGVADLAAVRDALATFMTACSRGSRAPDLAIALASGVGVPRSLDDRINALAAALVDAAPDSEAVLATVADSWNSLGILAGIRPWARAIPLFGPVVRRAGGRGVLDPSVMTAIERDVREMRSSALLDTNRMRLPPTQLMNFHQTKGREADAVILVYRDGDFLAGWRDREPYEESSRVLYVALTRARQCVSIILPPDPHPLVAPFSRFG